MNAIIVSCHFPTEDSLSIGHDIIDRCKTFLGDVDFFIGVNPSPYADTFIESLPIEYYKEITPSHLVIESDASGFQTALRLLKQSGKQYDNYWFLHTQGTRSGLHHVREWHLNCLVNNSEQALNKLNIDPRIGVYGRTIHPISNYIVPPQSKFFLDRYISSILKYEPLHWFFAGTMFIIKGHILHSFLDACNDSFFNTRLVGLNGPDIGDCLFIERDLIHIVDRQGYIMYPEHIIDGYGILVSAVNSIEPDLHNLYPQSIVESNTGWQNCYLSDLKRWLIHNNQDLDILDKIIIEEKY